uniref:Putative tick til 22 n=1 Tax=Amblyomma americanum TaxID=6943 RepID=A0A0C9SDB0_AMBAM
MRTLLVVLAALFVLDVALARRPSKKICVPPSPGTPMRHPSCNIHPNQKRFGKPCCRKNEVLRWDGSRCGEDSCACLKRGGRPFICPLDLALACFCKDGFFRHSKSGLCVKKRQCGMFQ